ncbi:MAG TPA: hypothetical protein VKU80_19250 [Planctomycetota bacterium]|nr:hypothetical protein [Planctomycetota bacterium]
MRTWILGVLAATWGGSLLAAQGAPRQGAELPTLFYFFTPKSAGSLEGAKRAVTFMKVHQGQVKLRLVMLLDDFSVIRKLEEASPLYKTLKELQSQGTLDVPLYDEEGLLLAERWGIRSVPAFVLVSHGRAHRALGPVVNLEELLECRS